MSKSQVDRLGERLRLGPIGETELQELSLYRERFSSAYRTVAERVREGLGYVPTGRPAKSTSAIVEKLRRESIRLSQIQDIAGLRLVVASVRDQDEAVNRIREAFSSVTVVDRRERPSNGYRAVHVVVSIDGFPVEVQVRTELQHQWAEVSEKLADMVDPSVKYGGGPDWVVEFLRRNSEVVGSLEEQERRAWRLKSAVAVSPHADAEIRAEVEAAAADARALSRQFQEDLTQFLEKIRTLKGGAQ